MKKTSDNLLLIFTRNPELGKCKTRLASTVGDKTALEIYKFLLAHTVSYTRNLDFDKYVYYSEEIWEQDIWSNSNYSKKLQHGIDLGERMYNAFSDAFKQGYKRVGIIGSDMYDMNQIEIEDAFKKLETHNFVLGPAKDGGYYLMGMDSMYQPLFKDKAWGTGTVLKHTLENLKGKDVVLLETKNDIDLFEDIEDIAAFQPFLKK